jgi:hypothetical protein
MGKNIQLVRLQEKMLLQSAATAATARIWERKNNYSYSSNGFFSTAQQS